MCVLTVERLQEGNYTSQVKCECYEDTSAHASYFLLLIMKLQGKELLIKSNLVEWEWAKCIDQIEGVLLHLDEVEIETMNNTKINWQLDVDELMFSLKKKNFISSADDLSISMLNMKNFYRD